MTPKRLRRVWVFLGLWCATWAGGTRAARAADAAAPEPLAWPPVTRQCRPWAYNWWLGSAVDEADLDRELRRYRDGGLGGIHVIPVYGAKGAEPRYVPYLSPEWMRLLAHAVSEADRLDLGVDMTTGTGWCFGGPTVEPGDGVRGARVRATPVAAGGTFDLMFDPATTLAAVAVAADGARVDLLAEAARAQPDGAPRRPWRAWDKAWTVYVLFDRPTGLKVKRAGPGGEGLMLNPFSGRAVENYLAGFSGAFDADACRGPMPRAMYQDSYEYFGSRASPELPAAFEKRRGYRLADHLNELASLATKEPAARAGRVRCDWRETASDLMIEESMPKWVAWCRGRGMLTRYQAHGAPANLLDLYALADVPETEMFGRGERDPLKSGFDDRFGEGSRDPLFCKFASSAAHVAGRRLASAETGTWMAEHFCETLEEMKCLVDRMLVSGVNHVFYHGCCYSPDEAGWPGWHFYAATEMNPRNAIWRDAPALNEYVARCQSVLQSGEPDGDVLLYWPIHDLWSGPGDDGADPTSLASCTADAGVWLRGQPVGETAGLLWKRGWGFDYVSDRMLAGAKAKGGGVKVPGGAYRAVVLPRVTHLPPATLRQLLALAKDGATVVFEDRLPADVPGLGDLEGRRAELREMLEGLTFEGPREGSGGLRRAAVGKGRVFAGPVEAALNAAGVRREALTDHAGAMFVRRRHEAGRHYFIANQGGRRMDGWFALATPARSVAVMDPMTGRTGVAEARPAERGDEGKGGGRVAVRLRLEPGHSILLRTFADEAVTGPAWQWPEPGPAARELKGPWQVTFIEGGPTLPRGFEAAAPRSWAGRGDREAERFAGTAVYRTNFDFAAAGNGPWVLDLGRVCHSARVRLNGRELGTLLMEPYRLELPGDLLKPTGNVLAVEVTNLSANRIRDLDRRKVPWKVFRDINVVDIHYKPFDASGWPVFDSGLLGPVTLRPEVAPPAGGAGR